MAARDSGSWPAGQSTMARLIRTQDWAATPMGPIGDWPQSLKGPIELMLSLPQPAYVGWGPDLISFYNDAYAPLLEGKRRGVLGQPFRSTWAELMPTVEEFLGLALGGTASSFEDQFLRLPAHEGRTEGWFSGSWVPLYDGSAVAGFMAMFMETTGRVLAERHMRESLAELKRTQAALTANEERLRLATESANIFTWEIEESTGLVHYSTDIAQLFGFNPRSSFDQGGLIDMVHPDDRAAVAAGMKEARSSTGRFRGEYRARVGEGWLWVYTVVDAHRGPDGSIERWIGMSQDISQHKQAEQRQVTLLAELQHRVRNILATTRSIARRTGETCRTVEEYAQHLDGRISALARTQALLTRCPGSGVDLRGMVVEELRPTAATARNVTLSGPDILVSPKTAEVLSLAIHELATNSVKYGALAHGGGTLDVRWRRQRRGDVRWLCLRWREGGMDLANGPVRSGFGTELVTRRVPYELRGDGAIEFCKDGLVARIDFPLVEGDSVLQTTAVKARDGGFD